MPANWPDADAVFAFTQPLIKKFEGFETKPYQDSAGIPTIGYGTIQYPDGSPVAMTDPEINADEALAYLKFEMNKKTAALALMLQRKPSLHQAAAMLSLAYNIGSGAFKGSTVLKKFNLGDIPGAAAAFLLWNKATIDGEHVVIPGLQNRRVAERDVFLTAD